MKTLLEPIVADALLKVTAWAGHLLKSHQIDAPLMCAQFEKKLKLLTRALATSNSMIKPGAKAYSLGFDDAAATSLSPAQILLETHAACERLLKTLKAFPEFNSILPWPDLHPGLARDQFLGVTSNPFPPLRQDSLHPAVPGREAGRSPNAPAQRRPA